MPVRSPFVLLLAALAALACAAPAAAGGVAEVDGAVLRYTVDDQEPANVTIDLVGGELLLDERASRPSAAAGCAIDPVDRYRVHCPGAAVERIEVRLGFLGSDVRIRAALPAKLDGGPGDDLLVGGPAEDAIDGGGGHDILGGGPGADLLEGGPGSDLVTYADRLARDGALLERRDAVRATVGRESWSGSGDERDTIARDVEQLAGGAGADSFSLRDGQVTGLTCGGGRDHATIDPRDSVEIDCESTRLAPPPGGTRITAPTLPFPFASVNDRGRSAIAVEPLLPLHGGAVVLRVSCPAGLGLLELVRALPCLGRVRFTRSGAEMGVRRVSVPRGGAIAVRLPLSESRTLARRAEGLTVTATAIPDRGSVERSLTFRVKG